jgi:hypothetical protein
MASGLIELQEGCNRDWRTCHLHTHLLPVSGFRVWGLGFGVWGLGCRLLDVGCGGEALRLGFEFVVLHLESLLLGLSLFRV